MLGLTLQNTKENAEARGKQPSEDHENWLQNNRLRIVERITVETAEQDIHRLQESKSEMLKINLWKALKSTKLDCMKNHEKCMKSMDISRKIRMALYEIRKCPCATKP